ncbi:MAG: tripartite tricarboxylate transporter substrate binding protein [Xanthobacteraceae bacterium]
MITRRAVLAASGSLAATALAPRALAQDYPAKPVRIIVPYAAGGATDILARLLNARLEQELKQSFVIDNRGGGASQVGTQAIATAPPDGTTIGLIDSAFTINPGLFAGKLPYDTLRDFAAVSLVATAPLVLVAHPSVEVKTAQELIALAKQKPGGLSFALPGLGTPVHLAAEQLRQVAGIEVVTVPYRGAGPSIADFIAGQVQMTFATVPSILEHVRAGRARALGMVGERSPLLPEVPTMAQAGLAGIDAALMFGLVVPAATPAAIVSRLSEVAATCVRTEPLRGRLEELGYVPIGSTPDEFRARIALDIAKWSRIIETGNIKPN